MRDGCVSCGCTGESSGFSLMRETGDCVVVGEWQTMCTTYSGVAGWRETGENTIVACAAFVEDVTHMDMKRDATNP